MIQNGRKINVKITKIKKFYLTTDDVRFCDYSIDIKYTHTFTGTYHMQRIYTYKYIYNKYNTYIKYFIAT